jgi:hypothetical protein
MSPQQEALEAAKMAAMIGSQLKTVDQLSFGGSNPANRININEFISCVNNPNARISNKFLQPPPGFAPPIPEELVQQQIQYTPLVIPTEQTQNVQQNVQQTVETVPVLQNIPAQVVVKKEESVSVNTKTENSLVEEIASLKKSVDQINKTLIRLVDIIRSKK